MVNKFIITILLISFNYDIAAQKNSDPDLQSLIEAERSFSQMAKEKNTRDAFLTFFADDVVTSAPDQGPRVGKKHLKEQTPNDSWLFWEPLYSDISASGDFGFNTGPWEFRQNKSDEKPAAFGQFVSMWKKNKDGEWKVVLDIGISHGPPKVKPEFRTSAIKLNATSHPSVADKIEILDVEKNFIEALIKKDNQAYASVLSKEAIFYRPGAEPYIAQSDIKRLLATEDKFNYSIMGGDIAQSDDLAYVYGKANTVVVANGISQTKQHSYMRFWKKEDGKNWKLILDLISN